MGLEGSNLEDRLRNLPGMRFTKQASLVDFGWRYANLLEWANANLVANSELLIGAIL